MEDIKKRLEYLREEIRGECISYGEIIELASLVGYIDSNDVELLQWAGVEGLLVKLTDSNYFKNK